MLIAVTADLHLKESHPERLENLEHLIDQLLSRKIRLLIIAGDLFDTTDDSYAQVDSLARRLSEIQLLILPGNHDAALRAGMFAAKNIQVLSKPTLKRFDQRLFLFLPYKDGSTIGQTMAGLRESERLKANPWILVSHGDFTAPRRADSGREKGYYPLTREDLARYRPAKVILGHIHVPNSQDEDILYPGSPYPITADEYGPRRVLLVDTKTTAVEELHLTYPPVYLRTEVFLIPDGREEEQIRTQLEGIPAGQGELRVRVILKGYTADRGRAQRIVVAVLSERKISCSGVDLDTLKVNEDETLATVADTVRERVAQLKLDYEDEQGLRQAVLEKALSIVYGA